MNPSTSHRRRADATGACATNGAAAPASGPLAATLFGPIAGTLAEPFLQAFLRWAPAPTFAAPPPSAAQWKPWLKTVLDWREAVGERIEDNAWEGPRAWHQRYDTAGLFEFGRQVAHTTHQLGKQWLDAQLLAAAQWREQGFALLPQWLDARGQADAALIAGEAQQAARRQWDTQNEALMQWFSDAGPAYQACLQQWLDDDPDERRARADADANVDAPAPDPA
ncbi:hypothetical protein FHX57_001138 [Paraburkholderia tropica]|uniref:hypothetical protein n=1 Tax=Paraburkholderia tropica TaxID=92647 RepID=UPI001621882E|nr:hypothetical protein [Paraburkholderia tropica]MBB2998810.1 hypothetical protein [Paraburkholderia tropica]MBB6318414.1 hypothetical protein [Paraburkholderia tropica]